MSKKNIDAGDTFALQIKYNMIKDYKSDDVPYQHLGLGDIPKKVLKKYDGKYIIINVVTKARVSYSERDRYYGRFMIIDDLDNLDEKKLNSYKYIIHLMRRADELKELYPNLSKEIDKKKTENELIKTSIDNLTFFLRTRKIMKALTYIGNFTLLPPDYEVYNGDVYWVCYLGSTPESFIKYIIYYNELYPQ